MYFIYYFLQNVHTFTVACKEAAAFLFNRHELFETFSTFIRRVKQYSFIILFGGIYMNSFALMAFSFACLSFTFAVSADAKIKS